MISAAVVATVYSSTAGELDPPQTKKVYLYVDEERDFNTYGLKNFSFHSTIWGSYCQVIMIIITGGLTPYKNENMFKVKS